MTGLLLAEAREHVSRLLLGALYTEDVAGLGGKARFEGGVLHWPGGVTVPAVPVPAGALDVHGPARHGGEPVTDPVRLLELLAGPHEGLAAELADAVANLAVAAARRPVLKQDALAEALSLGPDDGALLLERLATGGHNLHPCGRTRLGMSRDDVLRYDIEGPGFALLFARIPRELHTGDDVGAAMGFAGDTRFAVQPVHPWQWDNVLCRAPGITLAEGLAVQAAPTGSLRTLLTSAGHLVKVSLDVQVTSTRRSVSLATALNGPVVSEVLRELVAGTGGALLAEYAGAGARLAHGERDATALLREPLAAVVRPGELAVPGNALPAVCPVTGRTVLELLAAGQDRLEFFTAYATALLRPVTALAAAGAGLEAHLQNCVPVFRDGRIVRMVFRDLGGVRLHLPRLAASGHPLELYPGSVTGTTDIEVMRSKVSYTALVNHLGALVGGLGLGPAGWAAAGQVLRACYTMLDGPEAAADLEAFTTRPWSHKALVTMRMTGSGDIYVPVENPL
ncbi:IucA/IucC family protein [Longispora albida]|uniref:IucA/IucC family protein n=1 Tax=Longispora albida TaxID=203523 RepID=UPI000371A76B|nr:IucA/IucC family siderophore biosynthesis protein [Longispora albida]